jgi:hypothetical protein
VAERSGSLSFLAQSGDSQKFLDCRDCCPSSERTSNLCPTVTMPAAKPSRPFGDSFGKYWNPAQPGFLESKAYENEDDDGSDMSVWESEKEDKNLTKPKFKNSADGKVLEI